uniref:Uncharacterized protein n=1 Tax=Setaria digitata TaxID=48799 RepID=A0A915PRT3_9BILA
MEGSTSCTSDNDVANTSRESENMTEICNAATPASGSNSSSFLNEAPSPLGHLDPHRLRDMVVDKQTACQAQVESPYKQPYWTPSPADPSHSPSSNIRSTPASSNSPIMQPPRLPGGLRDSALLSPSVSRTSAQQQSLGMCLPGLVFILALQITLYPMGSPSGMHPPPSPFLGRPSSNASPSPYMQPPQTPIHYQANLQSPAGAVPSNHVPPSPPCTPYLPRIPTVGPTQQQYSCHAQMQQPQWTGQQAQQGALDFYVRLVAIVLITYK